MAKIEEDFSFSFEQDAIDFAISAGFTVTGDIASRPDQPTRQFKLVKNRAGRWEWKNA